MNLDTVKRLDLRARPITYDTPGTWYGVAETLLLYAIIAGFFGWFLGLYVTEITITTDTVLTDGSSYTITLECVNHNGCNVSYIHDVNSPCKTLRTISDAYYRVNQTFEVYVCRGSDFSQGVVIWATYDNIYQSTVVGKPWLVELVQPHQTPIPFPDFSESKLRVTTVKQRVDIDRIADRVTGTLWEVEAAVNSIVEQRCLSLTLPFTWGCGGYLVKPSQFFIHRTKERSGNLRADVFAPVLAVYSVLVTLSKCFSRTKITHRDLKRLQARNSDEL